MKRVLVTIGLACLCATSLAGCGRYNRDRDNVIAALQHTAQLSSRYVYDEKTSGQEVAVKGVIADDYQAKAELDVNGQPRVEEVVADDAVGDHFLDADAITLLARRNASGDLLAPPTDDAAVGSSGISVVNALESQRWVVDASGAPTIVGATGAHPLGQDPFFDARDVFNYAEAAARQAQFVKRYDSESIDPVYKTVDDPFPKPSHGAKLQRFDYAPRAIPRRDATNGANQRVPDVGTIRRMVVYVENGVVVRIMELVNLDWKLTDLKRNYSLNLTGSTEQQATQALEGINAVRVGQGDVPIRARLLDFQLADVGGPEEVSLPTQAVYGPLHLLVNRGRTATTPSS